MAVDAVTGHMTAMVRAADTIASGIGMFPLGEWGDYDYVIYDAPSIILVRVKKRFIQAVEILYSMALSLLPPYAHVATEVATLGWHA